MAIPWGTIAQIGAQVASNYSNTRNQQRQQQQGNAQVQNQQALQQNAQQNNLALQLAQLELAQRQMAEQNRSTRAAQTARGDLQANAQDLRIQAPSHIPRLNVSGGMRPSALGPNARQAGGELSRQALLALMQGDQFTTPQLQGPVDLNAGMPQESVLDKILAGVGTAGNLYGAYTAARGGQPTGASTGASTPQAGAAMGQASPSWMDTFMRMSGSGMAMPTSTRFGR